MARQLNERNVVNESVRLLRRYRPEPSRIPAPLRLSRRTVDRRKGGGRTGTAAASRLRPAGTVALTALEFDFENASARCEFLLYHTGHSSGTPGNVCDRLNTGAALRHLETGFPGGSRVRFRQLRFRPAEASSRGLLLHGCALLDLTESAFSAADRDGASRQLPDFSAVEQAVLRTLPRNRRPRLISARIEPDSEASFLFATAASPLPPATAAKAQRAVAAPPVR